MNGESILVGRKERRKEVRKEGKKEKEFNAFSTQMPLLHGLSRLWYEETIFQNF
jgi:hypothetical protein